MTAATFYTRLEHFIAKNGNPICFGLDPVLNRIPLKGSPEDIIRRYYLEILNELIKRNIKPAAIKPNIAYYEALSIQSLLVLEELIREYQHEGMLVVLDAKRGDIGKSSAAYAQAAFQVYKSDAVTVSPWMGSDSVEPFLSRHSEGRGIFALLRTSNQGASDFQDLVTDNGDKVYEKVALKLIEWDRKHPESVGAVVGATHPEELERITQIFASRQYEIPFLIPGVSIPGVPGQQGGDAITVIRALRAGGGKRRFHLLNSSSGLSFAWQAQDRPTDFAIACADAMERLAESIQKEML